MTDSIRAALERLLSKDAQVAYKAYVAFVQICKGNSDDAGTYDEDERLVRTALTCLDDLLKVVNNPANLLAQPAPPAEEEVAELVEWIHRQAVHGPDADEWRRAAELLAQRYPEPVPVGEEPWEREGWCDELGRCWFGAPQDGAADAGWILRKPSERLSHQTVSLPAHALPLPAGEVK